MKNIALAFALSFVCFASAQASDPMPAPVFDLCAFFDKEVSLDAGTVVFLEINEKIECHEVTDGQTIRFKTTQDVMAEGEIAIKTGAIAIGEVTYVKLGTLNGPAEIRIEMKYVRAVDGQQVPLNGNQLTVYGDDYGRGSGCTVRFSKDISANVTNDILVDSK